jgi:exosortase
LRLLVVTGLVVLYLPFVPSTAEVAAINPYAGHVLLVPVASALILWSRRDRLRTITSQSSLAGLVLIAAAIALLALAHTNRSYAVHALSVVVAGTGVALWLRGVAWSRQAAFPLGFLLLMLPPPRGLIATVSPLIQNFIARLSATALGLAHVPVERQGFVLYMPGARLHIDEGCNGLRFLLMLFVIVTVFAYLLIPTPGRRSILMMAAIPAAVLANGIRVTEIAAAAYLFGPQAATGWTHDYIGRATWLLTIAAFLAAAIALRRTAPPPQAPPLVALQPKKV